MKSNNCTFTTLGKCQSPPGTGSCLHQHRFFYRRYVLFLNSFYFTDVNFSSYGVLFIVSRASKCKIDNVTFSITVPNAELSRENNLHFHIASFLQIVPTMSCSWLPECLL